MSFFFNWTEQRYKNVVYNGTSKTDPVSLSPHTGNSVYLRTLRRTTLLPPMPSYDGRRADIYDRSRDGSVFSSVAVPFRTAQSYWRKETQLP